MAPAQRNHHYPTATARNSPGKALTIPRQQQKRLQQPQQSGRAHQTAPACESVLLQQVQQPLDRSLQLEHESMQSLRHAYTVQHAAPASASAPAQQGSGNYYNSARAPNMNRPTKQHGPSTVREPASQRYPQCAECGRHRLGECYRRRWERGPPRLGAHMQGLDGRDTYLGIRSMPARTT